MTQSSMPTKKPRDENFPVASLVLAGPQRAAILAFYSFARMADDIADGPDLSPEAKLRRLDDAEAALLAGDAGCRTRRASRCRHPPRGRPRRRRGSSCRRSGRTRSRRAMPTGPTSPIIAGVSAVPVGRFLLRLHGEGESADGPADALCVALQILNHLQDLRPDRERLGRVYLPHPWMECAGGEEAFFAPVSSRSRRPVLDAALDRVDDLIAIARALPGRLASAASSCPGECDHHAGGAPEPAAAAGRSHPHPHRGQPGGRRESVPPRPRCRCAKRRRLRRARDPPLGAPLWAPPSASACGASPRSADALSMRSMRSAALSTTSRMARPRYGEATLPRRMARRDRAASS